LARSAAAKALDLAPADPRAHVVLGLVAAFLDFDWKTADEHIQRAKATGHLAPEVRVRCTLILLPRGRFTEVIQELESVVAEDPLAVLPRTILALDLFLAGQYDRSEAEAKIAMEFDQVIWAARYVIGLSYAVRGRLGEAREWSEQAVRVSPWSPHCVALLAGVLERLGESERASELLAPLRSHPTRLFTYHVVCSNLDAAADCCEAAIAQCDPFPLLCAEAGFTEPLRQSPRWAAIARKLNLPAA
jgi:Flp pilus assembly protein TadD